MRMTHHTRVEQAQTTSCNLTTSRYRSFTGKPSCMVLELNQPCRFMRPKRRLASHPQFVCADLHGVLRNTLRCSPA